MRIFSFIFIFFLFSLSSAGADITSSTKGLWDDANSSNSGTVMGAVKSLGKTHHGTNFERAIIGWNEKQVHQGFSLYSQCLEIEKFINNLSASSSSDPDKASEILNLITRKEGLLSVLGGAFDKTKLGLGTSSADCLDGVQESDTTIFGLLKQIQKALLPQKFKGKGLPLLRFDSIYRPSSSSDSTTKEPIDAPLIALRTDAQARLASRNEGSLLSQLTTLNQSSLIGSVDNKTSFFPSLSACLDRLSNYLSSASFEEIVSLYPRFFYGENSFQTILIKITDSSPSLQSDIGTPFSKDGSLFGLVNQAFNHCLEPMHGALSQAINDLKTLSTNLSQNDNWKLIAQELGPEQSEGLYCSQLLDTLGYIKEECLSNLTAFASSNTIQNLNNLISGSDQSSEGNSTNSKSLVSLVKELVKKLEGEDLAGALSLIGKSPTSCLGETDNQDTLWGITVSILNKIYKAFFENLQSLNSGFPHIEEIGDYVQQTLFKMDISPFVQTLWNSDDSLGFRLLSTSSGVADSSSKADFNEAFYELLFTKPTSLIQQATKQLSSAQKELKETRSKLNSTQKQLKNALTDALQLIGEPLNSIDQNSDDPSLAFIEGFPSESTAFALLKEVELIMSSQKLFFEALKTWQNNQAFSNFGFFSFLPLLGAAPVDLKPTPEESIGPKEKSESQATNQSTSSFLEERSFFETINHLNPATSADILALTIGSRDTPANARCHSLFSFLNTALAALYEPFAKIHWTSTATQTSKSSTNIHEKVKSKLEAIKAEHTELTNFTDEILPKLDKVLSPFKEPQKEEPQEKIPPALAYKFIHATQLINQYVASFQSSDENSARIFCQELESLVTLELGAFLICPGCHSMVEDLRGIVQELAPLVEVAWSSTAATLFKEKKSFIPLTQSVQRFSTILEDFAEDLVQARTRYKGESCSLSHCSELQSPLMSSLKAIAQELKNLIKSNSLSIKEQKLAFPLNEGCPSLPSVLENLSKEINSLARNIPLPPESSYNYGLSQRETWKVLDQTLSRIRDSVASIASLTHKCCTDNTSALSNAIASLLKSLSSLNEKTSEIAEFIEKAGPLLFSLSDYWEEIASLLQKRSLFSSLPQETLWTALSTSTALEPWESLAEALENGSHVLPLTLEASHNIKEDTNIDKFRTLQSAIEEIVHAWNGLFNFLEGLAELNQTLPRVSSSTSSECTESTPDSPLLKALTHINETLARDTNFAEAFKASIQAPLETNVLIPTLERINTAYTSLIPYIQKEIGACEKGTSPYNSGENNNAIEDTLSSIQQRFTSVQETSKGIIHQLKDLCPGPSEQLLTTLTSQDLCLKAILAAASSEQDPQTSLSSFNKLAWSETFFPRWAEKMPPIIELVQFLVSEQEHITDKEKCLHYTLKAGLSRLETLVTKAVQTLWDTAKAQGLSPSADAEIVSDKSSPAEALTEAFNKTNGAFTALFDESFKLTSCQPSHLPSALDSLQASYEALAQTLQQLVEPLCLYNDPLTPQSKILLVASFYKRAACFKEALSKLTFDLQCAACNRAAIKAISSLVRDVVQRTEAEFNSATPPPLSDLTNQVEALEELNERTAEVLAFFQEAKEGSCLTDLLPLLQTSQSSAFEGATSPQDTENQGQKEPAADTTSSETQKQSLESALIKLRDTLPPLQKKTGKNQEDSNTQEQTEAFSTAKEPDLVAITQEAIAPLLELKKAAITASLAPCNLEVTTETKDELFTREVILERAAHALQTTANHCHLLAQTLKEAAPHFGCSKELDELAAPLEQCAEAEQCVAQTLLVKASHLKNALMPFKYEAHAATIETSTRYNGLSQPEWLEQTEKRNREIQKKTACLRQQIVGGSVLPCLKEHCVSPTFLASDKAPS